MAEQVVVLEPPTSASPIPQAPMAPLVHTAPHDSLKEAREKVEQGIATLLAGQVPPIFQHLFQGAQGASFEFSLEHFLG